MTDIRPTNSTGDLVFVGAMGAFAVYDAMPPPLRRALQEANCNFNPIKVALYVVKLIDQGSTQHDAIAGGINFVRQADHDESRQFSYRHQFKYGHRTPHDEAGATFLRYDEATKHKRRRAHVR